MRVPPHFPRFWVLLTLSLLCGFVFVSAGSKRNRGEFLHRGEETAGTADQLAFSAAEYLAQTARILGDRCDRQFYREAVCEVTARFSRSPMPEITEVTPASKNTFSELAETEEPDASLLGALEFLDEIEGAEISVSFTAFSVSRNPIDIFAETLTHVPNTYVQIQPAHSARCSEFSGMCGILFFLLSFTGGQVAGEVILRRLLLNFPLLIFTQFSLKQQNLYSSFFSGNRFPSLYLSQRKSVVLLR